MKRPVAVVGVGQTKHSARRADVNIAGLVREAVDRAIVTSAVNSAGGGGGSLVRAR